MVNYINAWGMLVRVAPLVGLIRKTNNPTGLTGNKRVGNDSHLNV